MISELNDQEILDFLMTSDLEGDYSPEELKYLLFKWRYFYRLLHGLSERTKVEIDGLIREKEEILENSQKKIEFLNQQISEKVEIIEKSKIRKLSWKERISGKIIQ